MTYTPMPSGNMPRFGDVMGADVEPNLYRKITTSAATTFVIPGKAKPKERPRFTKTGIAFTPKRTVDAERNVVAIAAPLFPVPFDGTVALEIIVVWPMPAGWSKRKRAEMIGQPVSRRPDNDNCLKSVSDALNGVAYADDQQVADSRVVKVWGAHARTMVAVERIGGVS